VPELTPLDHMLAIMRDPKMDMALRFDAAKAAAPYIHPRLNAIEHTGPGGGAIALDALVTDVAAMSQVERIQMVARLLRDGRMALPGPVGPIVELEAVPVEDDEASVAPSREVGS
jgi:hypothetical protein